MRRIVLVDDLVDRQNLTGRNYFVLGLLLIALLCDGFDLQLVAFAAPRIAADWGIEPTALGLVSSANLLGMMFGAMFLGNMGDRFGRKRVIVVGTILYACTALLCLLASNPPQLGMIRFFTGLGLGGVLPNVIALAAEISPSRKRAYLTSIPMIGMSLGSGLPAVVAAWLVPLYGWEALFVAGGIVPIVVALLIAWKLPESHAVPDLSGQEPRGDRGARARAGSLARDHAGYAVRAAHEGSGRDPARQHLRSVPGTLAVTTPLLWLMFACTLLSMHFLNSWISVILNQAGLCEEQTAFTNGVLHWGGTIAAIVTVFLLGRLGLNWALMLLLLGLHRLPDHRHHRLCVRAAAHGGRVHGRLRHRRLPGRAQYFGGPDLSGVLPAHGRRRGAGHRSHRFTERSDGRRLCPGAALPIQQMFFVPLLPLAMAVLATGVLMLRKVDIRAEAAAGH